MATKFHKLSNLDCKWNLKKKNKIDEFIISNSLNFFDQKGRELKRNLIDYKNFLQSSMRT